MQILVIFWKPLQWYAILRGVDWTRASRYKLFLNMDQSLVNFGKSTRTLEDLDTVEDLNIPRWTSIREDAHLGLS